MVASTARIFISESFRVVYQARNSVGPGPIRTLVLLLRHFGQGSSVRRCRIRSNLRHMLRVILREQIPMVSLSCYIALSGEYNPITVLGASP